MDTDERERYHHRPISCGLRAKEDKMSTNGARRPRSAALQRRRLGRELRSLRRAAGLSQTEVGAELYRSSATVSRVERGRVGVTPRDVRDMLRLYGVEDQRQELVHLALEARKRDSFWQAYGDVPPEHRTYVELEQSAVSIRQYECLAVPGLLQSREYATALSKAVFPNGTARHVAQHVELRLSRQALLVDDDPPRFEAVLDEGVLHRLVGGRKVMADQLSRLADAAELPNVALLVIPFDTGAHGGMAGAFTMLGFRDPADRDELYFEYSAGERMASAPSEVRRHAQLFAGLRHTALPSEESVARIRALAARLRGS
jgi:transcriptional regulator with XRE-family HTH domain